MNRLRWPQKLAISTAAVLLLWGLAGFVVTGFSGWAGEAETWVLGLRVNPLQNAIHVVCGLGLGLPVRRLKALGTFSLLSAAVLLVTFGVGAARYDDGVVNVLNVNFGSNALHLIAGFAALAVAQGAVWMRQCDKVKVA